MNYWISADYNLTWVTYNHQFAWQLDWTYENLPASQVKQQTANQQLQNLDSHQKSRQTQNQSPFKSLSRSTLAMEITFSEAICHNTQTLQLFQQVLGSVGISPKCSKNIKNVRHIPVHFSICGLVCNWSKNPKPKFFKHHDSRIWRHTLVEGHQWVCRHKRHGEPLNGQTDCLPLAQLKWIIWSWSINQSINQIKLSVSDIIPQSSINNHVQLKISLDLSIQRKNQILLQSSSTCHGSASPNTICLGTKCQLSGTKFFLPLDCLKRTQIPSWLTQLGAQGPRTSQANFKL